MDAQPVSSNDFFMTICGIIILMAVKNQENQKKQEKRRFSDIIFSLYQNRSFLAFFLFCLLSLIPRCLCAGSVCFVFGAGYSARALGGGTEF